jgi:hypothetical protein
MDQSHGRPARAAYREVRTVERQIGGLGQTHEVFTRRTLAHHQQEARAAGVPGSTAGYAIAE